MAKEYYTTFLTYTRNCEQQHNIAVVKSTFKIPPRHNVIIPIMIKGHDLKAHIEYFISNQHANKGLDPNIHATDAIYNIKDRSTFHILVANYTQICQIQQRTVHRSYRTIH